MPLISSSNYDSPPFYMFNGHMETIVPSIFNKVEDVNYVRETIDLKDGDFLDLDWLCAKSERLVILSHGMEGSSTRHYVKRSAKFFHQHGYDVLAWNNRGCGGTINRKIRAYHHGTGDDIEAVVNHALGKKSYQSIVLLGFSMGGSMVCKYLSVAPQLDKRIKGGAVFSVSCDLHDTVQKLENTISIYKNKFLAKLKYKVRLKQELHVELENIDIDQIDSFEKYHELITIPYNGYSSMEEFYYDASCVHHLHNLKRPVLMINALNDPLLGENCYPSGLADRHEHLFLETPKRGGHLGFTLKSLNYSYMEVAALSFIEEQLK